jgi:hypothetical protein
MLTSHVAERELWACAVPTGDIAEPSAFSIDVFSLLIRGHPNSLT